MYRVRYMNQIYSTVGRHYCA